MWNHAVGLECSGALFFAAWHKIAAAVLCGNPPPRLEKRSAGVVASNYNDHGRGTFQ
jgi:hypothetical protein